MKNKTADLSPSLKKWLVVVIRIILLIASAIGGDALEVLDLISQNL